LPYRDATTRTRSFELGLIPENVRAVFASKLPLMQDLQESEQAQIVNVETRARERLDDAGIMANERVPYLNFVRALYRAKGSQSGVALTKAADAEEAKFACSGLNPETLQGLRSLVDPPSAGMSLFPVFDEFGQVVVIVDYAGTAGFDEIIDLSSHVPNGAKFVWLQLRFSFTENPSEYGSWFNTMYVYDTKEGHGCAWMRLFIKRQKGETQDDRYLIGFVPLFGGKTIHVNVPSSIYQNAAEVDLLGYLI